MSIAIADATTATDACGAPTKAPMLPPSKPSASAMQRHGVVVDVCVAVTLALDVPETLGLGVPVSDALGVPV